VFVALSVMSCGGRDVAQLPEWGWGKRKSYVYLEVPAAEQAVVEDERFVD
jgi:hypothetical protein